MGLIKRSGIYYAEFYNSAKSPPAKRYSLRTRSKKPAESRYRRMQVDYEEGKWDPWKGPCITPPVTTSASLKEAPFEDIAQAFLESRARLGRSIETIRTYKEVLHGLGKRLPHSTLNGQSLADSILEFVYDGTFAAATRSKRYGHIRTFTKWARLKGFLDVNPIEMVEQPKQRKVFPRSISADQLDLICSAMIEDYRRKLKSRLVAEGEIIWRIPLFQFALYTGMRASELARLTWGDIDLDLKLVSIKKQKNGHQQTIPLCRRAAEVLMGLQSGHGNEFVFHSPRGDHYSRSAKRFSERSSQVFRLYRRMVGLPELICFHSLRHGFCTALANAGKSSFVIKAAARHQDISTTLRYVHLSNRRLFEEVNDVFD